MNLENIKSTTTWAEASGTMNNNNAKITEAIERLESAVEEGGGGGTADSVAWNKVTGKPSWITDSKPVYAKEDLSQGVQTSLDKADTALQAIPDGYATEEYTREQVRHILNLMSTALEGKVDKVDGKQLSTEDFTTALKEKLEALSSSGGGDVDSEALQELSDRLDLIVSGGTSGVIDSFIDVISFLTGINDSVKLKDMLDTLRESILRKQNTIEDLDAIRSGASLGATAVQRGESVAHAVSADSAEKASQDSEGNIITSTYATKTELGDKTNEDGVFIMFHRNSDNYPLMVKPEKWKSYQDSGEIAEGVVIVEGGKTLVVAPTETSLYWSSAAVSGGGKTTTSRQLALIDFEGKANSNKQNTHEECSSVNYANGYCAQYSRVNANGRGLNAGKWWLPSLGELMMIYANKDKVNQALSLITGATRLKDSWYWSSTESSASSAWFIHLDLGVVNNNSKSSNSRIVRPVSLFYNTDNTTIMPWSDIISSPNLGDFTSQLNNVASAVFATSADAAVKADKIETTEWIVGSHSSAPFVIRSLIYGGNVITCNHEGKVGVGTTNLTHTLTVNGEASFRNVRILNQGVDSWLRFSAYNDDNGISFGLNGCYRNQGFVIYNYGISSAALMISKDTNNVGIGTTDNKEITHKLTVNGTASISGDTTIGGTTTLRDVRMSDAIAIRMGVGTTISEDYALSVGGDVSVSGYVMTEGVSMYSQRSLKDVVDEEGLSLEELATIKPTRFTWKDGRDEKVHIGGIADDVQKVLPEAVRETPEGILTMDYPVASFAVASSLVKPVTDHEERIAELERENKRLREELEMIKRYIGYGNDK